MKLPNWPTISENKPLYGPERIEKILKKVLYLLGSPEEQMRNVFHVAGTNGKGSTTSFLKSIIEADGYKVNRFISPHLVNYNERIEICGKQITDEYYNSLAEEVKKVIRDNNIEISYFEGMTIIAFLAFARSGADANIIEVGLGGRLDATNVFTNPLVDVITSISFDHMHILGETLEKIAMEKFGIVKKGTPVVISKQKEEIADMLTSECMKIGSPYYVYGRQWKFTKHEHNCVFEGIYKMLYTPCPTVNGDYQIINAGTAIAALMAQNKLNISDEAIKDGIKNMFWPARIQNITDSKLGRLCGAELYLDGSHNEDGARTLSEWINKVNECDGKETIVILSILARKDTEAFVKQIANSVKKVIVVNADIKDQNFKNAKELEKELKSVNIQILGDFSNIIDPLKSISKMKDVDNMRIVITGSLYFAGYVLEELNK